jgi:hypothetical protein
LIIVINKDTNDAEPRWLDADFATKTFLAHFELSSAFQELRDKWATRGKTLRTAEDLILCYYDSFRVVCIPALTTRTSTVIAAQYRTLYREIRQSSAHLRDKRVGFGMKLNASSFSLYVEHASHRLAKDLKSPIDFYYLAKRNSGIPSSFSEHLTALIVKLQEKIASEEVGREAALLTRLIPYIACCIVLQILEYDDNQRKLLEDRSCVRRRFYNMIYRQTRGD